MFKKSKIVIFKMMMTIMIIMVVTMKIKKMTTTSIDTMNRLMTGSRSDQKVNNSFLSSFSFWFLAAKRRRGAETGEVSVRKRATTVIEIEQENKIVIGTGLGKERETELETGRESERESEMVGRTENEMGDARGNRIAGGKIVRGTERGARIRNEGKGERGIEARRGRGRGVVTDKKKEGGMGREGVRDTAVGIDKG